MNIKEGSRSLRWFGSHRGLTSVDLVNYWPAASVLILPYMDGMCSHPVSESSISIRGADQKIRQSGQRPHGFVNSAKSALSVATTPEPRIV